MMNLLGRIVEIDLGAGEVRSEQSCPEPARRILWGRGYNVLRLYQALPSISDPLGPENVLVFSCGLLTGTAAPVSTRLHVNALSPQTGLLGSSNLGGGVGPVLRGAGIQSLVLKGRAARPVYLYLDQERIEIRDASGLWGLSTGETEKRLAEECGSDKVKALTIGPAGENLVKFACIMSGRHHSAGRTGMGAVMGSKNLKAIVVAGRDPAYGSKEARQAVRSYARAITTTEEFKFFSLYGGAGYVKWADEQGLIGVNNFNQSRFDRIDELDGRKLKENVVRANGCNRCPVHCKAELRFANGRLKGASAVRPEFEAILNLGPKCGLADLEAVVYLDNLCSELGLDSISAASALAFAMDLFERGGLSEARLDGLDLSWGNPEAMEKLLVMISRREGLGAWLSQGVRDAAAELGPEAEARAPQVKGLELSGYDPRRMMGSALGYAVSSRGGDYNNVYSSLEHNWSAEKGAAEFGDAESVDLRGVAGKGRLMRRVVRVNIVLDSLGLCKVPVLSLLGAFDLRREAELTSALTGLNFTPEDLFRAGGLIADLERLINISRGAGQESDRLPSMFLEGPGPLTPENLEKMRREFYLAMGWDEQGRPAAPDPNFFTQERNLQDYHEGNRLQPETGFSVRPG